MHKCYNFSPRSCCRSHVLKPASDLFSVRKRLSFSLFNGGEMMLYSNLQAYFMDDDLAISFPFESTDSRESFGTKKQ